MVITKNTASRRWVAILVITKNTAIRRWVAIYGDHQ
jgi:hypothetical protein